jgi:hypothetical protein
MRALVVLALLIGPARAMAQDDAAQPPVVASVAAAALIAMGSLTTGGLVLATHQDSGSRKAGVYTFLGGMTLAPIVSHAIAGEWARAAVFGGVPLALTLGATWLIESSPDLMIEGSLGKRRALTVLSSLALLSAGIGLYDSMNAGQRARSRGLAVAPMLGRAEFGLAVGGLL